MWALYRDLNTFLKEKFGEKVYKISIDAGFSCPNLDGKISESGCTFCNNLSILPKDHKRDVNIEKQLEDGIEYMRKRHKSDKFIAYLQPYSNTYAGVDKLKRIYEPLITNEKVAGLAISTRPDCVDEKILDYIARVQEKKYLWLEFGLQSASNDTLKRINRGHSYEDFVKSFQMAASRKIPVCVHIILGFPWESKDMMLSTVRELSDLGIFGIKIHALHILKGTGLYDDYLGGKVDLLSFDSYVNLVTDSLEILNPDIVIHRLTGEGPRELTAAPEWIFNKLKVINAVKAELVKRCSYQGINFRS